MERTRHRLPTLSLAALLFAAAAAPRAEDASSGPKPGTRAPAAQPRLGEKAPAFKLKTVDGDKLSSGELLGHWSVLQFGASWCPYTNRKAPNLEALGRRFKDKNVRCVVIDIAEKKSKAAEWAKRKGFTVPVLLDADGSVSAGFAPSDIPYKGPRHELMSSATVILDPKGRIRYFQLPTEDEKTMADNDFELEAAGARLATLLASPPRER